MIKVELLPSINSIRRLKNAISEGFKGKYNSDRMVLYNYKGLELDDSDVEYLKDKQVIYASVDGK